VNSGDCAPKESALAKTKNKFTAFAQRIKSSFDFDSFAGRKEF